MERLLEPGRTSGPPFGSSGLSRIIRTLPRIVRLTAPKTPEGFHRSRIIRDSIRIIRTPDARIIWGPVRIIRPCLRTVRAEARVPLRPLRLYILFLLHLPRVSKVIAHLYVSFAPTFSS